MLPTSNDPLALQKSIFNFVCNEMADQNPKRNWPSLEVINCLQQFHFPQDWDVAGFVEVCKSRTVLRRSNIGSHSELSSTWNFKTQYKKCMSDTFNDLNVTVESFSSLFSTNPSAKFAVAPQMQQGSRYCKSWQKSGSCFYGQGCINAVAHYRPNQGSLFHTATSATVDSLRPSLSAIASNAAEFVPQMQERSWLYPDPQLQSL